MSPSGTSNALATGPGHGRHRFPRHGRHRFPRKVGPALVHDTRQQAEHCRPFASLLLVGKSSTSRNFTNTTVTLHERHGISNYRPLDYFFNSVFRLTSKKASKLAITHTLWDESTRDRWIFSPQRASNAERVFLSWCQNEKSLDLIHKSTLTLHLLN